MGLDIVALLVALLCGLVIGLERELKGKPAGVRTCALVCSASALFTLLGAQLSGSATDPGRLAAACIQGIGFLGAGAVLTMKGKVIGLTTAAVIWMVCAIGIACGFGEYRLAVVTTVLVLFVVLVVTKVENILKLHE